VHPIRNCFFFFFIALSPFFPRQDHLGPLLFFPPFFRQFVPTGFPWAFMTFFSPSLFFSFFAPNSFLARVFAAVLRSELFSPCLAFMNCFRLFFFPHPTPPVVSWTPFFLYRACGSAFFMTLPFNLCPPCLSARAYLVTRNRIVTFVPSNPICLHSVASFMFLCCFGRRREECTSFFVEDKQSFSSLHRVLE